MKFGFLKVKVFHDLHLAIAVLLIFNLSNYNLNIILTLIKQVYYQYSRFLDLHLLEFLKIF